MQPPTKPTPATAHERSAPRGDESELYRRHHRDLQRAVTRAVNAPLELVEDACQTAWAALPQTQPDRASIFAWLYVVATREARRLRKRDRRHTHLDAILPEGSWDTVLANAFSIDDILEAHEALQILASLPDRQRADLTLRVAGFSYAEIADDRRTHLHHRYLGWLMSPACRQAVVSIDDMSSTRINAVNRFERVSGSAMVDASRSWCSSQAVKSRASTQSAVSREKQSPSGKP